MIPKPTLSPLQTIWHAAEDFAAVGAASAELRRVGVTPATLVTADREMRNGVARLRASLVLLEAPITSPVPAGELLMPITVAEAQRRAAYATVAWLLEVCEAAVSQTAAVVRNIQ